MSCHNECVQEALVASIVCTTHKQQLGVAVLPKFYLFSVMSSFSVLPKGWAILETFHLTSVMYSFEVVLVIVPK